jgi:hypothetical protein
LETSNEALIDSLRRDRPGVPFLALGQTALWDEPMKAAWRRLLDRRYPDARVVAGVHDTDYFAKTTALIHGDSEYAILQHDDISTQGLWSAAGEMSALFGSEDVPTRAAYERNSAPIDRIAAGAPDRLAFLTEKTSAWGWRGIVSIQPKPRIAHDVSLSELLPVLLDQLAWACDTSVRSLAPEIRDAARSACDRLRHMIVEIASAQADSNLGDLYEGVLGRLYGLLLREQPRNFETTRSTRLFRFNRETCRLPRFQFVQLFLSPETATVCRNAYDSAVAGGGMYMLREFGDGALPFDIVVPGVGRGTLHITSESVTVDLAGGHRNVSEAPVRDLESLASVLEDRFGPDVVLIGKALTLVSMLASEFLVVFHETASAYTFRTAAMHDAIRAHGIKLDFNPIVRLQYPTWDALNVLGDRVAFELPEHLARSFGDSRVTAARFAAEWRHVVERQRDALVRTRSVRSVRGLLAHLRESGDETRDWAALLSRFDQIQQNLTAHAQSLADLRNYIATLKSERQALRRERDRLQAERGRHFRAAIRPLQAQIPLASDEERVGLHKRVSEEMALRDTQFTQPMHQIGAHVKQAGRVIKKWRSELRRVERSDAAMSSRIEAARIALDAESARLDQVRSALIDRLVAAGRGSDWRLVRCDRRWDDSAFGTAVARNNYASDNERHVRSAPARIEHADAAVSNREDFVEMVEKYVEYRRIEVFAATGGHDVERLIHGKRLLVRPTAKERIEHIGNGADAPKQGNLLARESVWVTRSVPLFVVRQSYRFAGLNQRGNRIAQNTPADQRVLPDHFELLDRKRSGF